MKKNEFVGRTVVIDRADVNYVCTVEEKGEGAFALRDQNTGVEHEVFGDDVAKDIMAGTAPNMQLI